MTDNVAVLDGFTQEWFGEIKQGVVCPTPCLYLLVKPGTDMAGTFTAWNTDEQAYCIVFGWLWDFTHVQP